jgi:hypothetical protein
MWPLTEKEEAEHEAFVAKKINIEDKVADL